MGAAEVETPAASATIPHCPTLHSGSLSSVCPSLQVRGHVALLENQAVVTAHIQGSEAALSEYNAPAATLVPLLLRRAADFSIDLSCSHTAAKLRMAVPLELVEGMPLFQELLQCCRPVGSVFSGSSSTAVYETLSDGVNQTAAVCEKAERDCKATGTEAPFDPPCSLWGLAALALISKGHSIGRILASPASDLSLASHTVLMADFLHAIKLRNQITSWLQGVLSELSTHCKSSLSKPATSTEVSTSGDNDLDTSKAWCFTQVLQQQPVAELLFTKVPSHMTIQEAQQLPASVLHKWLKMSVSAESRLQLLGKTLTQDQWERVLLCAASLTGIKTLEIMGAGYKSRILARWEYSKCTGCGARVNLCQCQWIKSPWDAANVRTSWCKDRGSIDMKCNCCGHLAHTCQNKASINCCVPFPVPCLEATLVSYAQLECLVLKDVFISREDVFSVGAALASVAATLRVLTLEFCTRKDVPFSGADKKGLFAAVAQLSKLEELIFPFWNEFVGTGTAVVEPLQHLPVLKHVRVVGASGIHAYGMKFVEAVSSAVAESNEELSGCT